MSTPFSEISKLMYNEMKKSSIYNQMDTEIALEYISDLILTGATVDFSTCNKNLENNIPYTEKRYNFILTQDESYIEIDITDLDEMLKNNTILYVNDIEVTNYITNIYSSTTDGKEYCKINYNFKDTNKIDIIFLTEGQFEDDLNHREKYIVALASYYHYLSGKIQEEDNFFKQLGDKDYKIIRGSLKNDYLELKSSVKNDLTIYITKYNQQTSTVDDFM